LAVHVAVAPGREALLRGREDRLARAAAVLALQALQRIVLGVARGRRRVAGEVVVVPDAPFLAVGLLTLALLALTGLALAWLTLALAAVGLPGLALAALAACALREILVLVLLAERILRALVALLLGAPHRLAQIVHLRRHLLLRGLLALIRIDAGGLARGVLEVLRRLVAVLARIVLLAAGL